MQQQPTSIRAAWSYASPCLSSYEIVQRANITVRVEFLNQKQSAKEKDKVVTSSAPTRNGFIRIEPYSSSNFGGHYRRSPPWKSPALFIHRRSDVVQALDNGDKEPLGVQEGLQTDGGSGLTGRVVAFTTPLQYATRFKKLLRDKGADPLWCPTIVTEQSEETRREVEVHVGRSESSREFPAHGIAFTSRAGIRAFADVLKCRQLPWQFHLPQEDEKYEYPPFIVAALGKDAELLQELNVFADSSKVAMVVPAVSTPQALVEALGEGKRRKLLCPVPQVEGLEEPPVVPQFLEELSRQGWDPVRVNSYVTRWSGWDCAKTLLVHSPPLTKIQFVPMDALVFTSTAEIEGLLKSLASLGHDGVRALQRGTRKFLVATHGPVTALGAERLGVQVDVVGKQFQSFAGVIKALEAEFCRKS